MGLLDDAIREHLELKRRRGADSGEITRLEQEAFGPLRRADAPPDDGADEPDTAPHLQLAAEPYDEVPADDLAQVQDEPPRPHGDPADDLPHAVEGHEPEDAPSYDEPEPPAASQPTRAFDAEEIRAATESPAPAPPIEEEDEEDGDDVLEETPEFLQETPEHDRLWFEQRPPRDFDF